MRIGRGSIGSLLLVVALRCAMLCLIALTLPAAPAAAQTPEFPINITAFAGVAMVPSAHPAVGIAVGVKPGLRGSTRPTPLSLEFEYSRSRSDPAGRVPSIVTFAGNFLVQPTRQTGRVRIYGTIGAGLYFHRLDDGGSEPNDAWNIGGGVKVTLAGPLRLRMDYRRFSLAPVTGEYHSNEHRFYAGLVLGF